jgi:hypothetical protein
MDDRRLFRVELERGLGRDGTPFGVGIWRDRVESCSADFATRVILPGLAGGQQGREQDADRRDAGL